MSQGGGGVGGGSGGFFSFPPPPPNGGFIDAFEPSGMLSEMFDFGSVRPQQNPQISNDNSSSMHLFLTNNHQTTSPSSHALIPNNHEFHAPQFTWIPDGSDQALSLSLASSLENANAAASNSYQQQQQLHFGYGTTSSSVFSLGAVNVLRNSRFSRSAQELWEEFCSVGRGGYYNNKKSTTHNNNNNNPTASTSGSGGGRGGSTTKDLPPLSPADRMEHQRRKLKLATMLDEVERRYNHYFEQMQMVVNSFDMVMGFGAAIPYTGLAQKAMSRHFRCLKDGIQAQVRQCCEVLGEKESGMSGITKGETPRLKVLEQSLRKQRAFYQMGIMEQEAWRPQRGLPERSVNVLRAWLFEHFLHPYPSDADKHLLARQTGLSRNQVANWFINARVRVWKPMIEEMYQQESKQRDDDDKEEEAAAQAADEEEEEEEEEEDREESNRNAQTTKTTTTTVATCAITSQQIQENDPSSLFISSSSSSYMNRHQQQQLPATKTTAMATTSMVEPTASSQVFTSHVLNDVVVCNHFGTTDSGAHHIYLDNASAAAGPGSAVGPTMIRFGTTPTAAGDVSLTLGLRHGATAAASRYPTENTGFSFTHFGRSS